MEYGKIITLGRHRLMCGDATRREDVMQLVAGERVNLVLTDPPYGMKVQDKEGHNGGGGASLIDSSTLRNGHRKKKQYIAQSRKYPQMIGDNSSDTARKHYPIAEKLTDKIILWGGQYFADFLPVNGGWLFWDKLTGNSDFSDGELAYCSIGKRVRKYVQQWSGAIIAGSSRLNALGGRRNRDTRSRIHPTQKPVEIHMRILEDFTNPGDIVLDCFGGSGTTLIACEMTGRKCLMMEISPEYCDIIAQRFSDLMPLFTHTKEDSQCPPQPD